jgi:hypothetical protein
MRRKPTRSPLAKTNLRQMALSPSKVSNTTFSQTTSCCDGVTMEVEQEVAATGTPFCTENHSSCEDSLLH